MTTLISGLVIVRSRIPTRGPLFGLITNVLPSDSAAMVDLSLVMEINEDGIKAEKLET